MEFCLTKLQALRANSSRFAAPRLIDVLNAFGLFAHARRDPRWTSVGRCLCFSRGESRPQYVAVRASTRLSAGATQGPFDGPPGGHGKR